VRDPSALTLLAESAKTIVRESDVLGGIGEGRLLLLVHGEIPCPSCLTDRVAGALYDRTHLRARAGVLRLAHDGRLSADLLDAASLVLKASWRQRHVEACPASVAQPAMIRRASA
jgi:hypothetical protein